MTRVPGPAPRLVLAAGAVIAFVGASLGFGAGAEIGFALLFVALLCVAFGIGARTGALGSSPIVLWLAWVTCGVGLALAFSAGAYTIGPVPLRELGSQLLAPLFIGLMVTLVGFCATGAALRQLPVAPAVVVAVGATLLATGVVGLERVADIGLWLLVPGLIALALSRWGSEPSREPA